jgi:carboxypeptidase T
MFMLTSIRSRIAIVILLLTSLLTAAETHDLYRVQLGLKQTPRSIMALGIDLEGAQIVKDQHLDVILSRQQAGKLRANGYSIAILIEDMQQYYAERLYQPAHKGFGSGSMGGFYTLSEVVDQLDSMASQYPGIITAKTSIGTSIEGRDIWMVKISDNPAQDEAEPEIFYNSLIHAREPASMTTVVYFMWHLLENYGSDPLVTYLVNHREMYFVPVINPDGYEYNRQIAPNGGGMWRKNRRNNGDGSYGVDLNRNYGYQWGYDNIGSSGNSYDITYRGTGPFSEPELQAIRDFCNAREFSHALNYHTYSDVWIKPFGYDDDVFLPDAERYDFWGLGMTAHNGYAFGTGIETIGYVANGVSDDWMYGATDEHEAIYAYTPEVGGSSDGFWPATDRILPLAQENLPANLYTARVAGAYVQVAELLYSSNRGNYPDPSETIDLGFVLLNIGRLDEADFQLVVAENPAFYELLSAGSGNFGVNAWDTTRVEAGYASILLNNTSLEAGTAVPVLVDCYSNGEFVETVTLEMTLGEKVRVTPDPTENLAAGWSMEAPWALTAEYVHNGDYAFSDSPEADYNNNLDLQLTSDVFTLPPSELLLLEFATRYSIESRYDFAIIEYSSNGGNTWDQLLGDHMTEGSGFGTQLSRTHGYEGQSEWLNESIDIGFLAGETVMFRFRLLTDVSVTYDGWYLDDLNVISYTYEDPVVGIGDNSGLTPEGFTLSKPYPNPFNPSVTINLTTMRDGTYSAVIYDLNGRRVNTLLHNSAIAAGTTALKWDGRDPAGQIVSSGVYLLQVKSASGQQQTQKLILVK